MTATSILLQDEALKILLQQEGLLGAGVAGSHAYAGSSVTVAVRIRPLSATEMTLDPRICVETRGDAKIPAKPQQRPNAAAGADAEEGEPVARSLSGAIVAHRDDEGGARRLAERAEEIRAHARNVADVVADAVGDHTGVALVVLGDVLLELADQVRSDVRSLGEDRTFMAF